MEQMDSWFKMADEMEVEDANPEIKTYKYDVNSLVIEKTHAVPKVRQEIHNIAQVQKRIAKIDGAISLWQQKKAPLVAIVQKYQELAPVEEVKEIPKF